MASISTRWVLGSTMVALTACSADEPPSTTGAAPPVIGDIGATGAPARPAAPAQPAPGTVAATPTTTAAGTDAPADGSPRYVEASILDGFAPKLYCNNIKLSQCSAYGSKFNRLDSVKSFCPQMGGEITTYCPTDNVVARCITDADVLVHYYSVGEKPLTKETAEAKCAEPARKSRIIR